MTSIALWLCKRRINNDLFTMIMLILSLVLTLLIFIYKMSKPPKEPLPPGPPGIPLLGNLLTLDSNLHAYFAKLSKTYGAVLKVQLGSKIFVVLSSPSTAREVLKDHDAFFANRGMLDVVLTGLYGGKSMLFSPYGEHFRVLRKVSIQHLLSRTTLELQQGLRRRSTRDMVNRIYSNAEQPIKVYSFILVSTFHLFTSMLFGGALLTEDIKSFNLENHYEQATDKLFELLAEFNVSDLFPFLSMFDVQGLRGKMKTLVRSYYEPIFDLVINRRLKMGSNSEKDFLQVLLQLIDQDDHNNTPFTINHIKAILMDFFVAGRTLASTLEWVMAELMKNQDIMRRMQEEIDQYVGVNHIVEELHLPKLTYLHAVIKEALRLHPVNAMLVTRTPSESCLVAGYRIPKGSRVIVNTWALLRDPENWDNPLEFMPERFLCSGGDRSYIGTDFSYIPFGSGRRICIGLSLAERILPYILASLVHSFSWKLPEDTQLDMTEKYQLQVTKKIRLVVIPTPRLSEPKLYS